MKKHITINIKNLIENFSVVGQTIESTETIKQVITEALLEAINDVNLADDSETKNSCNSRSNNTKEIHTTLVDVVELKIQANNLDEIINAIRQEFEKHSDFHEFSGSLFGLARSLPIVSFATEFGN